MNGNESAGKSPSEVLYDSDLALRQIHAAIERLGVDARPADGGESPDADSTEPVGGGVAALSQNVSDGHARIVRIISSLQLGRGTLQQVAQERLLPVHHKLREVSTTADDAAADMLDGIERALALVDRLDDAEQTGTDDPALIRKELRERLFEVMTAMQYHDITRQHLNYASSVLLDTERRLAQIAAALEPDAGQTAAGVHVDPHAGTFDPDASAGHIAERQAAADEVFAAARATKPGHG